MDDTRKVTWLNPAGSAGSRRVTSASHPHFCIALSPRDRRVTVTYDGWETPLKGEMSDNAVVQLVDAGPMLYADLGGV